MSLFLFFIVSGRFKKIIFEHLNSFFPSFDSQVYIFELLLQLKINFIIDLFFHIQFFLLYENNILSNLSGNNNLEVL